jgi:DNA polymerase III subunit delta
VSPAQLLAQIRQGKQPSLLLLLGPEAYGRRRLKQAMMASLPEDAITEHDLTEATIAGVLDDARALSLFASERLIWVLNAEAALPRGRSADEEEAETGTASALDAATLTAYAKDPTPGVTVVFEAMRFDFEGDDKRKQDRVRKFYSAIPSVVELHRYAPHEARNEAETLLRQAGIRMDREALDLLVEALASDIARIAVEIEKLALFAGNRSIGVDDIAALVPDARSATIFALVNALGSRDRIHSLEVLDTLVKEGEYLPLVLAFLSTQFRMALVAREAGLRGSGQIVGHFTRMGMPMWSSRAEQLQQTISKFTQPQLESAVQLLYRADTGLRDARPDDRTIMEQFVVELTK